MYSDRLVTYVYTFGESGVTHFFLGWGYITPLWRQSFFSQTQQVARRSVLKVMLRNKTNVWHELHLKVMYGLLEGAHWSIYSFHYNQTVDWMTHLQSISIQYLLCYWIRRYEYMHYNYSFDVGTFMLYQFVAIKYSVLGFLFFSALFPSTSICIHTTFTARISSLFFILLSTKVTWFSSVPSTLTSSFFLSLVWYWYV